MNSRRLFLALMIVSTAAVSASAVDLSKVDRTLLKQPVYRTKTPRYGLLVFGPQAKTRVWVVVDGDALYIDRNSNGNLTDPGERVAMLREPAAAAPQPNAAPAAEDDPLFRTFAVPELSLEGVRYTDLTLEMIDDESASLSIKIDGRLEQTAYPELADRPAVAPILHLGGPLQFKLLTNEIKRGSRPGLVQIQIGTPGVGPDSFVAVANACVAVDQHPQADIEFASLAPDGPTVKVHLSLTGRCCGGNFDGLVRVPELAQPGPAKVTLSFANWKHGAVSPATFEVPVLAGPRAKSP